MSDLSKAFEASLIEDKWSAFWENKAIFVANPHSPKPSFSLVMPPPNVTGVLHMGHALVNTLQDVLTRWKRMQGYEVLWVPGTDHAGIATQTVVERNLIKETGKRRKDFSREEFLSYVWQWKEKSQHTILGQLKKLGCSCDWSRLCFTMDGPRNSAVSSAFKIFYDKGLIYRGDYLVNWDPITQTALADDEVEYEERASFLWHFKYPLRGQSGRFLSVATTRPETMLGDVAVAVNPSDERYRDLIGQYITLPLVGREIPIIADPFVDITFGTGAVKITPAHDPNDYEMALRHDLAMINIMTPDGKINHEGHAFCGFTMEEARQKVVAAMQELSLVDKIVPHTLRVGISYRSKAVIQPYLSKQWFVKMSSFKPLLRKLVEEKKVKLIPQSFESTYFHWIDNLRDWCISRQLWWGHRIPIWYHKNDCSVMLCHAGEGAPQEVKDHPELWVQDEDVLDTWFSSALWPFSTMGWPNQTEEMKKFYPTTTLITGHDILFFWVARMILMGQSITDCVPFSETFLHGLIYGKSYWRVAKDGTVNYLPAEERAIFDAGKPLTAGVESKWEKMSKSKGNIIDPIEIIEAFGTDAMRMALCASATQARQIDLDRRKFEEFKNFANKLWNGARFVLMNIDTLSAERFATGIDASLMTLEDRWILSMQSRAIEQVQIHLQQYAFDKAALTAYDFFWKELCAYYLEIAKPVLQGKVGSSTEKENKQKILAIVLLSALRLLHPMAPFITEELFLAIKTKLACPPSFPGIDPHTREAIDAMASQCCALSPYPSVIDPLAIDADVESKFSFIDSLLRTIRNIRAQMQLPPSTSSDVIIVGERGCLERKIGEDHRNIIEALVKIKTLHFSHEAPTFTFCAEARVGQLLIIIPLPEEMKEKERERLDKEKNKLSAQEESLRSKLASQEFLDKAPKEVVEKLQGQLDTLQTQLYDTEKKLKAMGS